MGSDQQKPGSLMWVAAVFIVAVVGFGLYKFRATDSVEEPINAELPDSSFDEPAPVQQAIPEEPEPIEEISEPDVADAQEPGDDELSPADKLIKMQNDKIKRDQYGNYFVDVTMPRSSLNYHLLASAPIRYTSVEELNHGVNGCASYGYVNEFGSTFSFVVDSAEGRRVTHFKCVFLEENQSYFMKEVDSNPALTNSIALIPPYVEPEEEIKD